jgi:glutathione S-transferase
MTLGAFASATGVGLLALAVALHGLPAFLLTTAISGAGYSLLFLSALKVINTAAPARQRGAVLAALYLLAYLSLGMVAIVLGIVASGWGLRLAIDLGAGVIALLSLAALALTSTMRASADRPFRPAPCCVLYQPVRSIMPEALRLYHAAESPNSRRVRMFLAENGISLPLISINLAAGEQHGDAYRAINPRRLVPTLMLEDGTAIGEVLAIWRYLEDTYPATPLLGTTPKEKALVAMWERRAELEGFAAVMQGVRSATPRLAGRAMAGPHDYTQIPDLVQRSKRRVTNFYGDMDSRLAQVPFLAGHNYSAAEITALVTVDFATCTFKMPIPAETAALQRWYDAVTPRPSSGV